MGIKDLYKVVGITYDQCKDWLMHKHYAKTMCPISYAFGLYNNDAKLEGIATFGTPVSSSLRAGICGLKHIDIVLEFNRFCLNEELPENVASYFIGKCLKLLPRPSIIISYADTAQGHIGYIYQACNFLYTGLSAKRTDWKLKGKECLHGATVADMSRGHEHRADYMRAKFGDDFYLQDRPRKHRYVYLLGNKWQIQELKTDLKYPIMPYPKGNSLKYDASYQPATQGLLI